MLLAIQEGFTRVEKADDTFHDDVIKGRHADIGVLAGIRVLEETIEDRTGSTQDNIVGRDNCIALKKKANVIKDRMLERFSNFVIDPN